MSEKDEEQQLCNSKPPTSSSGLGSLSGRHSWYGMPAPSNLKKQATQSSNNWFPPQIQLVRGAGEVERSKCAKCLPTDYPMPKAARKPHRDSQGHQAPCVGTGSQGGGWAPSSTPCWMFHSGMGSRGHRGLPTAPSLLQNSTEDKRTTAASR